MGAWGLGLFQSDHDHGRVATPMEESGLSALEKKHIRESKVKCYAWGERPGGTNHKVDISYGPLREMCSDMPLVRKHLESGSLASMIANWEGKMMAADSDAKWPNPRYMFVFLGACAMTLGCKLPETYKTSLRKTYRDAHLMRDAVKQMDMALNDTKRGYKDGVPYDFGSLMSLGAVADAGKAGMVPDEDRLYPSSQTMNCRAPFSMPPLSDNSLLQIRRNVLGKAFGSKSFAEVIDKVHSMYMPDELYTVPELKHNFLYTYPSATSIRTLLSDESALAIRSMPVMPADYMSELKAQLELIVRVAEMMDVTGKACGNCGAWEEGDGKPLPQCAKCKKEKYCSRACQEAHWKAHKKCARLAAGPPNTDTHPSIKALLELAKKQAGI